MDNASLFYKYRSHENEIIEGREFPINSREDFVQFFAEHGAAVKLWRSHELILAALAKAFQQTFALVAVSRAAVAEGSSPRSAPFEYNLYTFEPDKINYFEKIPSLPGGLPPPYARLGLLYHFSDHYQVSVKNWVFFPFR